MFKVLLFLSTLNASLIAQNTWRGLRFGMSEEEVRKTYKGTLRKDAGVPGQADYLRDDNQKLEDLPAHVQFTLDENSKTLKQISLTVTDPFTALPDGSQAPGASLAAINMLNRDLSEKYGKPVTEDGECNLTAARVVRGPDNFLCNKMWKSEGQTITMKWYFFDRRLQGVFLTYKPLPKDL